MKRIIIGSLIYYLPIVGNILLTITAYCCLGTQEATVIITGQFLAAAGVGVYGIVCGQATIILAKQKIIVERFLLRLLVLTFPAAIVGMVSLAFLSEKSVSQQLVLIAVSLTLVDGVLLILRTAGFTRYLNRRSKISFGLIGTSLLRIALSASPLTGSIGFVIGTAVIIAFILLIYAILFGIIRGGTKRRVRVAQLFQGRKIYYLLTAGYLNGIAPYLLMLGVERASANENLTELFVLRIALAGNLLVRASVDMMLATKRFAVAEIGLSGVSLFLMTVALLSNRVAIVMAVLPSLVYIAKSTHIHNLTKVDFNRTMIGPSVLVISYLVLNQFAPSKESVILAFMISTVSYVYFMKQRQGQWHHTFLISIACMGALLYAA